MATFALVHGAWHGAWCWERLVPELEGRGHAAVAPELPSDQVSATLGDYADAVTAVLDGCDEECVVVGHSLGGITIPLVPALRPVRRLVFLCAFVPRPGVSVDEEFEQDEYELAPGAGEGRAKDERGRTYWSDPGRAIELLYTDCPLVDARRIVERLRPQEQSTAAEPSPLASWPEVPSEYIRCLDDRMYTEEMSLRMAARLGADPIALDGGHSPMLSRPSALADVLASLV